jgi:hypothetical protein
LLILRIEGRVFFANAGRIVNKMKPLIDQGKPRRPLAARCSLACVAQAKRGPATICREDALACVPSAAVAIKDLRPLLGALRTRVLDNHPRCGCGLIMRSISASLFSKRTGRSHGLNRVARDHQLSYINRNRARQTGTNRTTQAEISNLVRPGFPGRVKTERTPVFPG